MKLYINKFRKTVKLVCKRLLILLLVFPIIVIAQTPSENYVKSKSYRVPTNTSIPNPNPNEAKIDVTYVDGLGRPIQKIANKQSATGKDIISHIEYDEFGREAINYLPFSSQNDNMEIDQNALSNTFNYPKYLGGAPYSKKTFDFSPINRITAQGAPGSDWDIGSGHEIRFEELTNSNNEVILFIANRTPTQQGFDYTLGCDGYYLPNQLYKKVIKDENWRSGKNNTTEEFKDQFGRIVLKRTYNDETEHNTYYVYDILGNLVYVIPPLASDSIVQITESQVPYYYNQSVSYTGGSNPLLSSPLGSNYSVSGGGSMGITIDSGIIKLTFNGSWTGNAFIDPNKSFPINASLPVPDMEIGIIHFYNTSPTGVYKAVVVNNCIKFIDLTPETPPFVFSGGIQTTLIQNTIPSSDFNYQVAYSYTINANDNQELYYQYKYDYKNRLIEKKLPGKQWEFIVYDNLDRVVATGPTYNPFGGDETGWMITKYDKFSRSIYTGWIQSSISSEQRFALQVEQNGLQIINESKTVNDNNIDGLHVNYTNNVNPTSFKLLTVNYYDDYNYATVIPAPNDVFGESIATNVKGLTTGSLVRVLLNVNSNEVESSTIYYDAKKYRPIYSKTNNYIGGYTISKTKFSFDGLVELTEAYHKRSSSSTELKVVEEYEYSPQGRLINHFHTVNNKPKELLSHNEYDELGQLISKNVGGQNSSGSTSLQKVDYQYNIRGWMTAINDVTDLNVIIGDPTDLFAFKINYNQIDLSIEEETTPLFNGNIAQTLWRSAGDNILRKYGYRYDGLSRLTYSTYMRSNHLYNSYDENLTYDKNGNIQTLSRNGNLESIVSPSINIDDLIYRYSENSNQLLAVDDATNDPMGFKDDPNNTNDTNEVDYNYDPNGNMISDKNKGIEQITYNHMNLPIQITFADNNRINYLYDATGRKVRKTVVQNTTTTTTDYLGGYQYVNERLAFFPTSEGYVNISYCDICDANAPQVFTFNYAYNYTDHLGNVRLTYGFDEHDQVLKIMEENHYYPFGLKHTNYNTEKGKYDHGIEGNVQSKISQVPSNTILPYRLMYHKQERQEELGLNWDSFKWRNYDYTIARFMSIDPLTEDYTYNSPYAFAENKIGMGRELEGCELGPLAGPMVGVMLETSNTPPLTGTMNNISKNSIEFGFKSSETVSKYSESTLENFARGRNVEAEQLTKNGLEKNTETYKVTDPKTGKEGKTIPDSFDGKQPVEIKNVKYQGETKQMRLQREIANKEGLVPRLIINKSAKLSKNITNGNYKVDTYTAPPTSIIESTKTVKTPLPRRVESKPKKHDPTMFI